MVKSKKIILSTMVFAFTVCIAFTIAMLLPGNKAQAEELSGFSVSEYATVETDSNGDKLLKFKTTVGSDFLSENSSSVYTFGTLIYPKDNGEIDNNKTPFENKEALDGINIIAKSSQALTEGFTYNASVLFDKETLTSWILSQKPELESDKDGLETALSKVYENLYAKNFTAVSYAITDNGVIYSNDYYTSKNEVEELAGVVYTIIDDSYAEVVDYVGSATQVEIATEYRGYPVTSVGAKAFKDCNLLTSIKIHDSVTDIGVDAFNGCSASIVWGDNPSIASVKSYAFRGYKGTTLIIPNSVTSIGSGALEGCSSLESITIPFVGGNKGSYSGYNKVFGYIFGYKTMNNTASVSGAICQWYQRGGYHYHYYIPTSIKSVTITGGEIPSKAFYDCSSLTSVTIGNGVTSIGDHAFYGCYSLTSIEISNSVTSIGGYEGFAFCHVDPSTKVNYLGTIDEWAQIEFYDEYSNPLRRGLNLYINDVLVTEAKLTTATKISKHAFWGCISLTSIEISSSVTSIGSYAFIGCDSLTKLNYLGSIDEWAQIYFSNSLSNPLYYAKNLYINDVLVTEVKLTTATKISNFAFYDCDSLTSIEISNSVTSIDYSAFYDCRSLTRVTIGKGVTSIGGEAFCNCVNLKTVVNNSPYITIEKGSTNYGYVGFFANSVINVGR
ncbi:MAG: leucine-rich repeat domain-containing protein [Clostridia bacterium]|nr:leucine-rich repeat domain-containing protein [Clostridia bacterium]